MVDSYISWLSELNKKSGQTAGGKGANLAEMFNSKFPIPPAFVVTTKGYNYFIEETKIKEKIHEILESIDVDNTSELNDKSKQIREIMIGAEMPKNLKDEILEAYEDLSLDKRALAAASKDALSILKHSHEPVFVAVRSSATTEDLEDSSFAGQQETYLNVKGHTNLIEMVKRVLASLFTARAIYYRKKRGFSKEKFALAVVVQKMIDADRSGVMFSKNPVKNDGSILIEAVFGLGEGIVSGKINPDSYEVSDELEIISKKIGEKKTAITRSSSGETKQVKLTPEKSKEQVLSESQIKSLANYALKIESHYKKPQDIEYAIEANEIFITQSRPITTTSKESKGTVKGKEILSGMGASPGISSGKVRIIHDISELNKVEDGDILVTKMTNPDMVISMQKANGIITDEGGVTSHAAIVSREMGIPAVVGVGNATEKLKDGQIVSVNGSNGKVYSGEMEEEKIEIKPVVPTIKTKIKVIVDLPAAAPRAAKTKADSVGLLRLEGIIASSSKHPLQYVKDNDMESYEKLIEEGVTKIAEHFKEVWVRSSDLRTDEFNTLKGAPEIEGNPMLGDHGIRSSLKNPKILEAEFKAIKKCAEKLKDKTFGIMLPQIISPEEISKAKKIAQDVGLLEMKNTKFGIMVETPAACLIIKHLLKEGVDFISFGTNDLTQYTLAIDRNNEEVQDLFDETHPAVLNAIKRVLRTCVEMKVESSICGQAGSKKPMAKFLIENGINSISVNADAAYEISKYVAELESQGNEELSKDPNIKVKEVAKKAEIAMAAEVMAHPSQQQSINEEVKKPLPGEPIPEKTPSYVADTFKDQNALNELFGNTPKMESETDIEEPEPINKEEDSEEDEVIDVF